MTIAWAHGQRCEQQHRASASPSARWRAVEPQIRALGDVSLRTDWNTVCSRRYRKKEKEQAEPWRGQAWELPRRSRGRAKGIGSQGWAGWMTSDAAAARERPEGTWAPRLSDVGKGG